MSLGLESKQVRLALDHEAWSHAFDAERRRILDAIGSDVMAVEHVGSTAIPGVRAKPILDILIGVASFEGAEVCVEPMERLGYIYRGEYGLARRHYFVKGEPRTHHVHMVEVSSEAWSSTMKFRDILRARPEFACDYADAKRVLAASHARNRTVYQAHKDQVVMQILRKVANPAAAPATLVDKAFGYITRGRQLLVFTEPDFPDAGIQVPGGTVEPNEQVCDAALRESQEETGLAGLGMVRPLGMTLYRAASGRIHRRHYFHLSAPAGTPDRWDHWERSAHNGEAPILFRFEWVDTDDVPDLAGRQGVMLERLRASLACSC